VADCHADLIDAMQADTGKKTEELRVDGGASHSAFIMQFQADLLQIPCPSCRDGNDGPRRGLSRRFGLGYWKSLDSIARQWKVEKVFERKCRVPGRRIALPMERCVGRPHAGSSPREPSQAKQAQQIIAASRQSAELPPNHLFEAKRDAGAGAEKSRALDMIIVGGGATGAGVAVDAATRGYATLLLEQYDFAKATSSRSTKLVHGGVRYPRTGNISLVMEH